MRKSRRPDSKAHRVPSFTLKKPEGTFPGLTTGHYSSSWNKSYCDEIKTWMSLLIVDVSMHLSSSHLCLSRLTIWSDWCRAYSHSATIITSGSLSAQQTNIIYFSKDVPATRIQILKHRNPTCLRSVPLMYRHSHSVCIFKNTRTLQWISSQWYSVREYFVASQWSLTMKDPKYIFEELRVEQL